MLIFHKIIDGEICDSDYNLILWLSLGGPVLSIILIIVGIIYLLIKIPYWIIFGKDDD